MRAHRAFRQLNTLLNRAGMNVLRFDYSCTGDSAGASEDSSVEAWLDDTDWAIDELKDNAMADDIIVVGLRMGAILGTLAAAKRDDVAHVLLWDPIVSGRAYLDEALGTPRPSSLAGVEGFPISPSLQKEIDELDLMQPVADLAPTSLSVMVSEEDAIYEEMANAQRVDGVDVRFDHVPSEGNWAQADPFGDALIPQQIIQSMVERLKTLKI